MAQYTMDLREIVRTNNVPIFTVPYPIYDEAHRSILETKITNHYMFMEIGVETVGRFIFNLGTRMNEIMPYYNKLYETETLDQRILDNYDVIETYIKENTSTGDLNTHGTNNIIGTNHDLAIDNGSTGTTQNDTGTTTRKQLHSDTPQGRVNFDDLGYVSDMTQDVNTSEDEAIGTGSHTNTVTGTGGTTNDVIITGLETKTDQANENWTRTMKGNIGIQTDANAVTQYRDALLKIDLMIIGELKDLFMQIY
jgi:hypothetical protein